MNPRLEGQMRRAGWVPGRHVATADAKNALSAAGYEPFEALTDLLAEFSPLTFRSDDSQRSVWIDGLRSATDADPDWAQEYGRLAGSLLAPIGRYSHMTIYVAQDGTLYGGFDREFGRLGADVKEALNGLLNQDPLPRLDLRAGGD
jgi:hypothetical protein